MTGATLRFDGVVFEWTGEGAWHFVRLPVEVAEEVRDLLVGPPRGFGSVRVTARIGGTTWSTSVFPEKDTGSYLLPVKKEVRAAEGILTDDGVRVELTIGSPEGEGDS